MTLLSWAVNVPLLGLHPLSPYFFGIRTRRPSKSYTVVVHHTIADGKDRKTIRRLMSRIPQNKIPILKGGKLLIKTAKPINKRTPMNDRTHRDKALGNQAVAVKRLKLYSEAREVCDLRTVHTVHILSGSKDRHRGSEEPGIPKIIAVQISYECTLSKRWP